MKRRISLSILPAMIALLATLFLAAPAFAQDEVPPSPEEAPIEELVEKSTPIGATLVETGVEVVDVEGELVPLVEELAIVDPWFKVGTVIYSFTTADCNPNAPGDQSCPNPFQAAVDYIDTTGMIPSDGFIHMDAGILNNQAVDIDGSHSNLAKLKGITGHVNPDSFVPDAILENTPGLGSYISIHEKTNGFTLSGLKILGDPPGYGVVEFINTSGTILLQDLVVKNTLASGAGIYISNHNGSITLKNVDSSDNTGGGAYLNNTYGTSGVTIINSSFNNNDGWVTQHVGGISIATRGVVSITGISTSFNYGGESGLFIQQSGAVSIKNGLFNDNDGYGISNDFSFLNVIPTGNITLTNVIMDYNFLGNKFFTKGSVSFTDVCASANRQGNLIDTCNSTSGECEWTGTGTVTIKNSRFEHNGGYETSLFIRARGAITLFNVTVSDNSDPVEDTGGAWLGNYQSQIAVPITITNSSFNNNEWNGLSINSKGLIKIKNISASGNLDYGIWADNSWGVSVGISISGSSSLHNQMNDNGELGLYLRSRGLVSISYSDIMGNGMSGAAIYNNYPGSLAGVSFSNSNLNNNDGTNLEIYSFGTITLSMIDSHSSINGSGAILDNSLSSSSPAVTTSNASFWGNSGNGIRIISKGNIILTNTAGWDNGVSSYGAYLNNTPGAGYVKISNPTSTDLDMFAGFNRNNHGVTIRSNGMVTLTNINVLENDSWGLEIALEQNKGVTLTNCRLDQNGNAGALIDTIGPIIVNGGHANGNSSHGINLENNLAADNLIKPVTVKNFTANNNYGYGVWIRSKGAIIVSNVTVNNTSGTPYAGIHLENTSSVTNAGITLSKVYTNENAYRGINILSNGAIKLGTVQASNNGSSGIFIDTLGSIYLSNVIANGNALHGADIGNEFSSINAPITVTGSSNGNSFNYNNGTGLRIASKGLISLKYITANHNVEFGINLNNYQAGSGLGNVIFSSVTTHGNLIHGIQIVTNGAVYLSYVSSAMNNAHGIYIGSNNHNVYVTNSLFFGNFGYGMFANVGTGTYVMTNTYYFGNDADMDGDGNINIVH